MGNDFLDNYTRKAQSEQTAANNAKKAPVQQNNTNAQNANSSSQQENNIKTSKNNEYGFSAPQNFTQQSQENSSESLNFEEQTGFAPPSNSGGGFVQEKNKLPWGYIIIGAIALIAIIIFAILLSRGTPLPAMADEGWQINDAQLWASENDVLIRTEDQFSDTIAINTIISQSPAAGETVASGEFLQLIVSAGPDLSILVPVPDVMNMSISELETWAEQNLMTKVRITTEDSLTIPAGEVIEFTVNDNSVIDTQIRRDTPFYVVFSNGKGEGVSVTLPNFLTLSLEEAEKFGTDNNIIIKIEEEFSDTIAKGQIISQNIKAEQTIREGDTVTLTVSNGKEIRVPNFAALTKEEGSFEATQLGITITSTEKYMLGYSKGTLISQSMAIGSLYESGDYVELVYSLGDTLIMNSMIGQSESAIRDWLLPLNENGAALTINITYTESDKSAGTILSHDHINETIQINDRINFIVSSGKVIYAPDLVADEGASYPNIITREQAIATCTALNIVPVFKEQSAPNRDPGEVWQQGVAPGTRMSEGDTIELYVMPGSPTAAMPNFVGVDYTAVSTISNANYFNITLVPISTADNSLIDNKIISQDILPGTISTYGSTIRLEYYVAQPATPSP